MAGGAGLHGKPTSFSKSVGSGNGRAGRWQRCTLAGNANCCFSSSTDPGTVQLTALQALSHSITAANSRRRSYSCAHFTEEEIVT